MNGSTLRIPFRSINRLTSLLLFASSACSPKLAVWVSEYPNGSLPVRFQPAPDYAGCLAAAVAMAAEYVDGRRIVAAEILGHVEVAKGDVTRPAVLADWLRRRDLDLIVLAGNLTDEPPLGVRYWVKRRSYPVICTINRMGGDAQYNHAVVVIGMNNSDPSASPAVEEVHYLDPSSRVGLESTVATTFDTWWGHCGRPMMLVVKPPAPSANTGNPD